VTGVAPPEVYRQTEFRIRCDWGLTGARELAAEAGVVVVVDVLSFTTTLSLAVEQGVQVYPYDESDESAAAFAGARRAVLAQPRSRATESDVCLSPLSIGRALAHGVLAPGSAVVLPSPNGSAIARLMAQDTGLAVVGASLRNARAAAAWAWAHAGSRPIAVVAAGERWLDGQLRPAVEDLWGAGAVIAALLDAGLDSASPEAEAAAAGYRALIDPVGSARPVGETVPTMLRACASGQELLALGYGEEIAPAAELDVSAVVPVLLEEHFVAG
jgi:2-phosphosulfolactate phosphatase